MNRTGVDLYYTYSTDGGVTWATEERVSSETSANLTDGRTFTHDRFASRDNHVCPTFSARFWQPEAAAVDALFAPTWAAAPGTDNAERARPRRGERERTRRRRA